MKRSLEGELTVDSLHILHTPSMTFVLYPAPFVFPLEKLPFKPVTAICWVREKRFSMSAKTKAYRRRPTCIQVLYQIDLEVVSGPYIRVSEVPLFFWTAKGRREL